MKKEETKRIIIFGTANRADEAVEILQYFPQYNVVGFSDNDKTKWGMKKQGLDIIPPSDIKQKYKDSTIIIASSYYMEVGMQLIENNMIPDGGYLESVNQIIGKISESDRLVLKSRIQNIIEYHDLDYKEINLLKGDDKDSEKYLVICNGGYPKDGNPRCAFAHRRVLKYVETGMKVDVFGYIENTSFDEYVYQRIKVYEGGMLELQSLLSLKPYKKILIHFVSKEIIYCIYRAKKIEIPIIIWCHGYEVTPWFRTWFNYSCDEINENSSFWNDENKRRSEFLKNIFLLKNIHFIFVSNYLKNRVKKFVGELPIHYSIIHNFIDCEHYGFLDKQSESRLKILSIKNHKTRTYANDLTAKAILELSNRPFFSKLIFELYGDGELFEENFGELKKRNYPNVHIHKEFLSQDQMKELFKENGIFLSPTRMDSHQVTSSEAMSSGMTVITCNIGPMSEFMDEECASLFEGENYFMMAEEIEYLYYHPEEFLKKCKNAKERAEKQCGYKNTIQKEIDLILQ